MIRKWCRMHYHAALLGVVLSAIVSLPLALFPAALPPGAYQGLNHANFGIDELWYLSRGRDILDGHRLGNAVLREGKDGQESHFQYGEYAVLKPFVWLGIGDRIDIVALYRAYNMAGVAILVFLVYLLVYQEAGDRRLALASAAFVVGGYSIVYYRRLFTPEFIAYGRAVSPYMHSVAFFLFLNALSLARRTRRRGHVAAAGVLFGVLFYTYFFSWTFSLAMLLSLGALHLLQKDFAGLKTVAAIAGIGLVLGAYTVVRMALFFDTPEGIQRSYFHWSVHSRMPMVNATLATATVFWAFFMARRWRHPAVVLFTALLSAGWLSLNQQLVTGVIVQHFHYHWYFIVPSVILSGLYALFALAPAGAWKKRAFTALLVLLLVHASVGQVRAATGDALAVKLRQQEYRPILDALNDDRTPRVILAPDNPDVYLYTVYTKHDVFWNSTGAVLYHTPPERMEDVLFVSCHLNPACRNDFAGFYTRVMAADLESERMYRDAFAAVEGLASGMDFYAYQKARGTRAPAIIALRATLTNRLEGEYERRAASPDAFRALLKQYHVAYLVADTERHGEWDVESIPGRTLLRQSGPLSLYSISLDSL